MLGAHLRSLLSQNGWLLNLVFIVLGAYFTAGAANAVVAHQVRVVPSADATAPSADSARSLSTRSQGRGIFEAMANRNLFGVKRENIHPVVEEPEPVQADGASSEDLQFDESELRPCSLGNSLRATLVAESAPEWSIAVIYSSRDRETQILSINPGSNQVTDDATLVEIRSREIIVRRGDHFERCLCEGEGGASSRPASTARSRSRGRQGRDDDDDDDSSKGGVTKVSEGEYTVDRSEVDDVLSNLSKVATQARIVPSFKNGKPNGFKLFSIKPGSIYSKIGLQNGDVVQKVNGYEINSPDKALEIYQKLKDATGISVDIQRRGRFRHFNYSIR